MKNLTTAALLLACVLFLLPQASEAGKPGSARQPQDKTCPPVPSTTACADKLDTAYNNIQDYLDQTYLYEGEGPVPAIFLSRNKEQDAATLKCKFSGAEIKLSEDKVDEATGLLDKVLYKIWSMYLENDKKSKLTYAGLVFIEDDTNAVKTCISDNYGS